MATIKIKTGEAKVGAILPNDYSRIIRVEELCFEFPWTLVALRRVLTSAKGHGLIVERGDVVLGYIIYEIHRDRLHILNIATAVAFQRQGVGRALLGIAKGMLNSDRRRILCDVRETNLDAQLFFRACGFRALKVLRDWYDDTDEDGIVFSYNPTADVPQSTEAAR